MSTDYEALKTRKPDAWAILTDGHWKEGIGVKGAVNTFTLEEDARDICADLNGRTTQHWRVEPCYRDGDNWYWINEQPR